jgi:predicted CXXCH cytochrome family protein
VNRVCARCHTVLFTRYPHTWEGGARKDAFPGGSSINSGEGRDFLLGGCSTEMSCVSCHDPHAEDSREELVAIGGLRGNGICVQCHATLRDDTALRAHSHHRTDGEGSACVSCHMPRKNMGLGYELTRYHRIGSPTDPQRVLQDRPLECALCHPNASVETTVRQMERWWGKRYDRARLRRLYGNDLAVNVLESTLSWGKPHEQAVAIGVFGERGVERAVPRLVPHLSHEYPLVRFFAKHAIESITGESLPIDPNRPASEIESQVVGWRNERSLGGTIIPIP